MSSSNVVRWGGAAAMVGGGLWVIFGALEAQPLGASHTPEPFAIHDPSLYLIYHLPGAIATLLVAIGLLGLGRRLAQPAGLLAKAGVVLAYIAVVGSVVNAVALATLFIPLHFAGAMIGIFSLGIGTILIGVAALRNAGWRRWRALPLATGILGVLMFPLSMAVGPSSFQSVALIALYGLGWIAVGYRLRAERGAAAEQPRPDVV